ncbi:Gcd10p family-domain-containing protein [Syncephalis plumigaleata]|nr:Gcd10p family-domain-containing protein [Syncephalis plumigaleata]
MATQEQAACSTNNTLTTTMEGEHSSNDQNGSLCIQELVYTFIRMPSGNTKMVRLQRGHTVSLGKFGSFQADDIIGKPFGLSYEVVGKRQLRVIHRLDEDDAAYDSDANNKDIVQDGSSQQLSYTEIEKLKRDGLDGKLDAETLIQKVAENNQSFDKKTEYSKAKYMKRKRQKFSKVFTPIRPTLHAVCDHFFTKTPSKIMDIRLDTLSQLLTFGNVFAGTRMLVVDDAQGMLVSALLDRMGGHGQVLAIHDGENHNFDVIRYLNFPRHCTEPLRTISWDQIYNTNEDEDANEAENTTEELSEWQQRSMDRRRIRRERIQEARNLLNAGGFDGLLVATQLCPISVLKHLLPYVAGSRPIIFYGACKELLVDLTAYMRRSPECLNVQLTESWLREHQVLSGRTHPLMNMSSGGGFLVTATKVIDCPSLPSYRNQMSSSSASVALNNEQGE